MTPQQILARASASLEAAAARARARDAEILRQRAAALRALPRRPGAAEAGATPPTDFARIEHQIAAKLAAAERDASATALLTEDEALSRWQAADADAYTKYMRAVDDARNAYVGTIDRLADAIHTVNAAEQARFIRDRAFAAAEAEYRLAKTADYDTYARASAAAREQAIHAIERARGEADTARRAAADARDAEVANATDTSGTERGEADANADMAAAIRDAFEQQMAQSKVDAEREKADVLARMHAELVSIGQTV